jgi:hypothetical protein
MLRGCQLGVFDVELQGDPFVGPCLRLLRNARQVLLAVAAVVRHGRLLQGDQGSLRDAKAPAGHRRCGR